MNFRELIEDTSKLNEKLKVTLNTKTQNVYLAVGDKKIVVDYDSDRHDIIIKLMDLGVDITKSVQSLITKAAIIAGDR